MFRLLYFNSELVNKDIILMTFITKYTKMYKMIAK